VSTDDRHGRRLILYTDDRLADPYAAKTAHGLLRFCPDRVTAIVDRRFAGQPLGAACSWASHLDVPIVASVDDLDSRRGSLVVGVSPAGGQLSESQRKVLVGALEAGFVVINGLHDQLPEGPNTFNLRALDPADRVLGKGDPGDATRILTVGTSGGIGKMTTTILLHHALVANGVDADWLATGQTGLIIRGWGAVIDSVVIDFVPGTIERLLRGTASGTVVIEGQGAIFHPAYSPSTVALMHACRPQHHVVCHRSGQRRHRETNGAIPPLVDAVRGYQLVFEGLGIDSDLLGVSLDSSGTTFDAYVRERDAITDRLGVPCCDPVRESADPFAAALLARPR
jgi:D-glutamate N-acetyltransferase